MLIVKINAPQSQEVLFRKLKLNKLF